MAPMEHVVVLVVVSVFAVIPLGAIFLAAIGKLDLNRLLDDSPKCRRCGTTRVGNFCGNCGLKDPNRPPPA